jgi:hypothetical protein
MQLIQWIELTWRISHLRGIWLIWTRLRIWLLRELLRVGTALGRKVLSTLILVLLVGVLSNGTSNRTTDGSEEAVVSLVASETTDSTTGKGTGKTTLTILCLTRGGLLLLLVVRLWVLRLRVLILRFWVLLRI